MRDDLHCYIFKAAICALLDEETKGAWRQCGGMGQGYGNYVGIEREKSKECTLLLLGSHHNSGKE